VQIRVEERALMLSMMANVMNLLFIVAVAERVSYSVGLIPKLSQGYFDVVIASARAPARHSAFALRLLLFTLQALVQS